MTPRRLSRHAGRGPLRRRGADASIAVVTSEGRIVAMRVLLGTSLLLALAIHWLNG